MSSSDLNSSLMPSLDLNNRLYSSLEKWLIAMDGRTTDSPGVDIYPKGSWSYFRGHGYTFSPQYEFAQGTMFQKESLQKFLSENLNENIDLDRLKESDIRQKITEISKKIKDLPPSVRNSPIRQFKLIDLRKIERPGVAVYRNDTTLNSVISSLASWGGKVYTFTNKWPDAEGIPFEKASLQQFLEGNLGETVDLSDEDVVIRKIHQIRDRAYAASKDFMDAYEESKHPKAIEAPADEVSSENNDEIFNAQESSSSEFQGKSDNFVSQDISETVTILIPEEVREEEAAQVHELAIEILYLPTSCGTQSPVREVFDTDDLFESSPETRDLLQVCTAVSQTVEPLILGEAYSSAEVDNVGASQIDEVPKETETMTSCEVPAAASEEEVLAPDLTKKTAKKKILPHVQKVDLQGKTQISRVRDLEAKSRGVIIAFSSTASDVQQASRVLLTKIAGVNNAVISKRKFSRTAELIFEAVRFQSDKRDANDYKLVNFVERLTRSGR